MYVYLNDWYACAVWVGGSRALTFSSCCFDSTFSTCFPRYKLCKVPIVGLTSVTSCCACADSLSLTGDFTNGDEDD